MGGCSLSVQLPPQSIASPGFLRQGWAWGWQNQAGGGWEGRFAGRRGTTHLQRDPKLGSSDSPHTLHAPSAWALPPRMWCSAAGQLCRRCCRAFVFVPRVSSPSSLLAGPLQGRPHPTLSWKDKDFLCTVPSASPALCPLCRWSHGTPPRTATAARDGRSPTANRPRGWGSPGSRSAQGHQLGRERQQRPRHEDGDLAGPQHPSPDPQPSKGPAAGAAGLAWSRDIPGTPRTEDIHGKQ